MQEDKQMRSRHLGKRLKRAIATVLTVALLASDNAVLYAAGADTAALGNTELQEGTATAAPIMWRAAGM